jgi:hypothetical protein
LAFHSGREAGHSPPSSSEVKEKVELYLHSPNAPSWRGAQLGGALGTVAAFGRTDGRNEEFHGGADSWSVLEPGISLI